MSKDHGILRHQHQGLLDEGLARTLAGDPKRDIVNKRGIALDSEGAGGDTEADQLLLEQNIGCGANLDLVELV